MPDSAAHLDAIASLEAAIAALTHRLAMEQSGESWRPLNEALPILSATQGPVSRTLIETLILIEWLLVDGRHVRNVGCGKEKPRYEFNVQPCEVLIREWKSLEPHERTRMMEDAA